MKQRLTSRDIRAQETRRRLMETARELLSTTEYMKLRVSDIAKAAGVSVGTFYLYFPSKQAVVAAQLREINNKLSGIQPVDPSISIEKQYCGYVDFYHQYMLSNGYMLSKALQTAIMQEGIDPHDAGLFLQSEYLAHLIGVGFECGELRGNEEDAQRFIRLFFDAINGILFAWIASGGDRQTLDTGMENLKRLIRLMKP